jgi:hypothetical protein
MIPSILPENMTGHLKLSLLQLDLDPFISQ